ncbi:MAG: hypothetical protein H8E10_09270 [Desulfobacterales bacterium]|nr:hypothetical protein [Desulfobacterales bacterium]
MTKAKYTDEERKQIFINRGIALAEYNKANPRIVPEKEKEERKARSIINLSVINKNKHLYEGKRLRGLRESEKAKDAARRVLSEFRDQILEKRSKNPGFMKCPENFCALEWVLMAPNGEIHSFKNLANFIRENEYLFEKECVVWKSRGVVGSHGDTGVSCLAYDGLCSLKPYNKKGKIKSHQKKSWRGWIWCGGIDKPNSLL